MEGYFVDYRGKRLGPFPPGNLHALVANGTIPTDALVWADGMTDWVPIAALYAGPPPIPASTTRIATTGYADIWTRTQAFVLDVIFCVGIAFAMMFAVEGFLKVVANPEPGLINAANSAVRGIFYTSYFMGFVASPKQATPGMQIMGIVIADRYGRRVSPARAFWRYMASAVTPLTLGAGFIMAVFDKRSQALHDKLSGCVVLSRAGK